MLSCEIPDHATISIAIEGIRASPILERLRGIVSLDPHVLGTRFKRILKLFLSFRSRGPLCASGRWPAGVLGSIPSVMFWKWSPLAFQFADQVDQAFDAAPEPVQFQTTRASRSRRWDIASLRPGRSNCVPDSISVKDAFTSGAV